MANTGDLLVLAGVILYLKYKRMTMLPFPEESNSDQDILLMTIAVLYVKYMSMRLPLPAFPLRIEKRLFGNDMNNGPRAVNDLCTKMREHPYEFWILSGDTPESFN
jgi:hypothetical protein